MPFFTAAVNNAAFKSATVVRDAVVATTTGRGAASRSRLDINLFL